MSDKDYRRQTLEQLALPALADAVASMGVHNPQSARNIGETMHAAITGLMDGLPTVAEALAATEPAPTTRHLMTFGVALAELKDGQSVARAGWNGKGQFVYLVPAASYPAQTGAAKAHFGDGALVPYNAYLALKGADNTVSTWAPSGSDALAEDWYIVE